MRLLARTLGRTVEELGATMTALEFEQHYHDFRHQPWDELRGDLRAAMVATTLANIHRGSDAPPYRASDFMPYLEQPPEDDEMPADVDTLRAVFGGG